jgi:anti-sigma B factor antagonist
MEVTARLDGGVLVLELEGEIMGGPETQKLRNVVDDAIKKENINVVVDMSKVKWMNSSGLGLLISALTSLRSSGGDLKLACLTERLKRPIQVTKLDSVFEDFETVQEAVKSYH